jgi:anti-sigma regulatory factor (Ser/Thr protein kinase)
VERVFQVSHPGVPEAVSQVRHQVAAALAGVPAADDAVWCLGEVATNAVVHTRSGQPGGSFAVAADVYPGALVAIVVTDQGGPWTGRAADTYPHGLDVVRQLATEVRIDGDDNGRSVWVILPWGQDAIPIQNDSAPRHLQERYPPGADPSGHPEVRDTWPLHSSLKLGALPAPGSRRDGDERPPRTRIDETGYRSLRQDSGRRRHSPDHRVSSFVSFGSGIWPQLGDGVCRVCGWSTLRKRLTPGSSRHPTMTNRSSYRWTRRCGAGRHSAA